MMGRASGAKERGLHILEQRMEVGDKYSSRELLSTRQRLFEVRGKGVR